MSAILSGAPFGASEPSIRSLIDAVAKEAPDAGAIGALGRRPLTFDRLNLHLYKVRSQLNELGVGRNDRVALLVPNGPEMAVAFLAVASCATSAPLNPAYRVNEFEAYLSHVKAKALVIQAGSDSPAIAAAQRLGIAIIGLIPDVQAEAGSFSLIGSPMGRLARDGFAHPSDTALVLPTSGTTGQPKLVPLTHVNICASARNIAASLALGPLDRSLVVMPLYHVHGLMAGIVAPLSAGASVVCPPGFDAAKFFAWMEEFRPTWYTAVPTIHQAVLSAAPTYRAVIDATPLRFIRSSSAPLSPRDEAKLEDLFHAPVIQAYGMTEASHQISTNPLPPGRRKAGSVGVPTGCTVAIMSTDGSMQRPGDVGEIVIRGANVMQGYETDPTANATTFADGWFRSGDQGFVDADGYIFITGRLKELINRGGAKISPHEIETVLLDHPAVAQAVAFAVPHPTLGEDVAAAVVLQENAETTESEIRRFAATRLADFRVPAQLLVVGDLPKGPSGKLDRRKLTERLTPLLRPAFIPPRDVVEEALARIWADVLSLEQVGIHDNFFELGGDSLSVVRMFAQLRKAFHRDLPPATLFQAATVAQLADILRREGSAAPWSSLVAVQPHGTRPPFFCVHSAGGHVLNFRELAHHLGSDQPFYGIQSQGLDGIRQPFTRIEDMAAHYVAEIRALQPKGPYFLGGHSLGGLVAYETARQIHAMGEEIALLALIDTYLPSRFYVAPIARALGPGIYFRLRRAFLPPLQRAMFHLDRLRQLEPRERLVYVKRKSRIAGSNIRNALFPGSRPPSRAIEDPLDPVIRRVHRANQQAAGRYVPQPYPGRVVLLLARARVPYRSDPQRGWASLAAGGVEIVRVPGGHVDVLYGSEVRVLARALRICLDQALAGGARQPGSASSGCPSENPAGRRGHA